VVIVWRLDHWGRSLADLVTTLQELTQLGIGFISLNEALDLTTPAGRAMAGMLSVFAEFEREIIRERVKAGIRRQKPKGDRSGVRRRRRKRNLRPCWFIAGQTVQALRAACVRRADFASDLARNELAGLHLRHAGDRRCLPVRVQPRITRQENELARMGHGGLVRPEGFASIFLALLALQSDIPNAGQIFHLAAIVIATSIVLHSSTDILVAKWYKQKAP
jgi:Resolvase, N terminal domain